MSIREIMENGLILPQYLPPYVTGSVDTVTAANSTIIVQGTPRNITLEVNPDLSVNTLNPMADLNIEPNTTPSITSFTYSSNAGDATSLSCVSTDGCYLYNCGYNNGTLIVVDISIPTDPRVVSTTAGMSSNCMRLVAQGSLLYIAGASQIDCINVANPYLPVHLSALSIPTYPSDLAVQGQYVFVTDMGTTFYACDFSDPNSPAVISTLTYGGATVLSVKGEFAYCLSFNPNSTPLSYLTVINCSDLSVLTVQSVFLFGSNYSPQWQSLEGNYLYCFTALGSVIIINIDNPAALAQVGIISIPGTYTGLVVGTRMYCNSSPNVICVDVSNPASPVILSTTQLAVGASGYGIDSSGTNIFITDYNNPVIYTCNFFGVVTNSLVTGSLFSSDAINQGNMYVGGNLSALSVSASTINCNNNLAVAGSVTTDALIYPSGGSVFGLMSGTSADVLYYNSGTNALTYGAAPASTTVSSDNTNLITATTVGSAVTLSEKVGAETPFLYQFQSPSVNGTNLSANGTVSGSNQCELGWAALNSPISSKPFLDFLISTGFPVYIRIVDQATLANYAVYKLTSYSGSTAYSYVFAMTYESSNFSSFTNGTNYYVYIGSSGGGSIPVIANTAVVYSNGSTITGDATEFTFNDALTNLTVTKPSAQATISTLLTLDSDPSGTHGFGAHLEIAGNPGGGGTIFRTDGGLNKSVLQIYGGGYDGTSGGQIYVNGNNSTSGDAGGVQIATGQTGASIQLLNTAYGVLLSANDVGSGQINIPFLTASQFVATDASKNLISVAAPSGGSLLLDGAVALTTTPTITLNSTNITTSYGTQIQVSGSSIIINNDVIIQGSLTLPTGTSLYVIGNIYLYGFLNAASNVTLACNDMVCTGVLSTDYVTFSNSSGTTSITATGNITFTNYQLQMQFLLFSGAFSINSRALYFYNNNVNDVLIVGFLGTGIAINTKFLEFENNSNTLYTGPSSSYGISLNATINADIIKFNNNSTVGQVGGVTLGSVSETYIECNLLEFTNNSSTVADGIYIVNGTLKADQITFSGNYTNVAPGGSYYGILFSTPSPSIITDILKVNANGATNNQNVYALGGTGIFTGLTGGSQPHIVFNNATNGATISGVPASAYT